MSAREQVKAVQQVLRALGEPVRVDGVAGPETRAAAAKMSNDSLVQHAIDRFPLPQPEEGWVFISDEEAESAIREASLMHPSVPVSYLRLVLELENKRARDGWLTKFDQKYKGLGQFDERTWNGVQKNGDRGIGDYANVRNSTFSLRAVASYYSLNRATIKKLRPDLIRKYDDRFAYLAHNQGAMGAVKIIDGGPMQGNQSPAVQKLSQIVVDSATI